MSLFTILVFIMVFLNFNAYRAVDLKKISDFANVIETHRASIITIQEIHVQNCMRIFSNQFQVYINLEKDSNDYIGICTLVRKNIKVLDYAICQNGRIIGVKLRDLQIWNIYPKSGTNNKRIREVFFREDLTDMLVLWKDSHSENKIVIGDYNCIHSLHDSLNNKQAHLQPGLVHFMKVHNLKDDYLYLHKNLPQAYSRITNRSATRIDLALSNISNLCTRFEYISYHGLDHKMILCEYSIPISVIHPKHENFHFEWRINKDLMDDEIFINGFKSYLTQIDNTLLRMGATLNPAYVWFIIKTSLIDWAKICHKQIVRKKRDHYFRIMQYYQMALLDIRNGTDCKEELNQIIGELNNFYRSKVRAIIDTAKYLEVKDDTFDIVKKQKEMKYIGGSKIDRIKIDNQVYNTDLEIINQVEKKMREELEHNSKKGIDDGWNDEDLQFLKYLPKLNLSNEKLEAIDSDICEQEVADILSNEVDLDSSPGLDGITYRFIKLFWTNDVNFRKFYLNYLNYIKNTGDFGMNQNLGLMVLKNKKGNSHEFGKKRKLTKMNKDINLLGKIWSNRCKMYIMDEIIPENQFVCSSNRNIIDELAQLRDINLSLIGSHGNERNGSILSIDFKNAFRSLYLHWISFVMRYIGFPLNFVKWFFNLYNKLGIIININGYRSNIILNERGVIEGHPPSMLCYVIGTIPLINALESKLKGIKVDDRVFKTKSFADDTKILLADTEEVHLVQQIVFSFERVSGVILHKDKNLKKCNVISFGNHRSFDRWPYWVNSSNKVKIIGGIFGNSFDIEQANSQMVKEKVLAKLFENWGMKGSLMQKSYFVNVFCLTKLNYICQVFKLSQRHSDEIKKYILRFVYLGQNERPVQVINFRKPKLGGLGIINPQIKATSLLLKTMFRELKMRGITFNGNMNLSQKIYGLNNEFLDYLKSGRDSYSAKQFYDELILKAVSNNGNLIPSRIEKKVLNVRWSRTHKNFSNLRFVTSIEREFCFKMFQDLVDVNQRIHRKNADPRCLRELKSNVLCSAIQDRQHAFIECRRIKDSIDMLKSILFEFTNRRFNDNDLLYISFSCKSKVLTNIAVWLIVKFMYRIYKKLFEKNYLLFEMRNEISFLIKEKLMEKYMKELVILENIIRSKV